MKIAKFQVGEIANVAHIGDVRILKIRSYLGCYYMYDIEILDRKEGHLPAKLPFVREAIINKKEE